MESHRKGDLTEATVVAELKRRGIAVSLPFGDNERYDLIAESNDDLYRIQVKTGWISDGCVRFHGKSSHTNSEGNVYKTYDGDIDFFAVYCHEIDQLYLIGESEFETQMILRVEEPVQAQPSINWAEEYEFDERWPPEDRSEADTDGRASVIRTLRDRDVDVFDARDCAAPYDVLLRSPDDNFFRAVIRRGSVTNGRIRFDTNRATPDEDVIDYVVVDCPELREQYLVDRSSYDRTISLRVEEPAQAQPSINWAEEYESDERWPPR